MHKYPRFVVLTVWSSLVVGACAGVIASVMTSQAIDDYAFMLLGDRGFTALEPRRPNTNPLDYDEAVRRVQATQSQSLGIITRTTADSASANQWLGPANSLGLGVVVSANGWLLTTVDELAGGQNALATYQVWVRGIRYNLEEMVSDNRSPFVLLKLKDATGLTPVGFAASDTVRSGDQVFMLVDTHGLQATTVVNSEQPILSGSQPAETFVTAWNLALSQDRPGPVLSRMGELLAFVKADGQTIPLHHGVAFVQDIIRAGDSSHATLGVYVIDLASVYNLDPTLRQGLYSGALVSAPVGRLAVPPRGPSAEAGVLNYDIITALDGVAITPTTALAEILTTYDPDQTVRLSVLRAGAPIEVVVTLGDAKDLIY